MTCLTANGGARFYVLKMFGQNHGDTILNVVEQNVPDRKVPMRGPAINPNDPRMRTVPQFYFDATRDSASGRIYLKIANMWRRRRPCTQKSPAFPKSSQAVRLFSEWGPTGRTRIRSRSKIVTTNESGRSWNRFCTDLPAEFVQRSDL